MARRATPALAFALVGLFPWSASHGQIKDARVGQRVVTHFGAVLKVGNLVVDDEGRGANLAATGKANNEFRVYRVGRVDGTRLWLKAESGTAEGWVESESVIPYENAIGYLSSRIRADPGDGSWYVGRGNVWSAMGETEQAIADYSEAIRLDARNEVAWLDRGYAWAKKAGFDKAIADYNEAIRLDPRYALAFHDRGLAWASKRELDKAIADYNVAARIDPKAAVTFHNRAMVWARKGNFEKAIADFDEAVRVDPKDAEAYNGRAWVWATCPDPKFRDGKKAVESATRACELSGWALAYTQGTLAAAYAESGDFKKAVDRQKAAEKLYTPEEKKAWGKLLALYKAKTPYRDVPETPPEPPKVGADSRGPSNGTGGA